MKRFAAAAVTAAAILSLFGCGSSEPETASFLAMDTVMELKVYGSADAVEAAEQKVYELESKLSVTDSESEIYAINQNGSGAVSDETAELLSDALALCEETGGALDISVYPIVREWGFTTGEYRVPTDREISSLLGTVDYSAVTLDSGTVTLSPGMEIDLGSVAKGYTGDCVAALLRESGVQSALLYLGGNVQTIGAKPDGSAWRIAVQNPFGGDNVAVVEVEDKAVITSGGYERYFEQDGETYWHIIDPATGYPARNGLVSVTVIGDSGLYCDGLSTALFVMGLDEAEQFWRDRRDFDAIFITEDGDMLITEGLEDCFTPLNDYADAEITVIR
jgi:thiamine biosynthesis lipoprotein